MRYVKGLVSGAAMAAATAALPLEAAPARAPWAKVGEWEIRPFRAGSCSADRVYSSGTRLSVSSRRDGFADLSVFNRAWSMQIGSHYRMRLVQGGERRGLAAQSNSFLHGLGLLAESGDGLFAQLAAGGILEIVHPDGRLLERLDLSGLAPALARLPTCIAQAATVENFPPVAPPPPPPPPRWGKGQPARAPAALVTLFSSDDYPAAAIRAGEEGAVGFRLTVGKDGRVTACAVTASSGSALLDSTTCQLITRRARFQPARDRRGRPTEDNVHGRIVWRLPEPEPEPPPLPQQGLSGRSYQVIEPTFSPSRQTSQIGQSASF